MPSLAFFPGLEISDQLEASQETDQSSILGHRHLVEIAFAHHPERLDDGHLRLQVLDRARRR
ncbi:MAG: hypothetical protein R2849_20540 [Thermomicrobiales bacterium]